jgi:cyclopropane fatty-acyl-phospholipid synthase-like methyltransferase
MERYHGKRIDPRELKQNDIDDLESKVRESREQAQEYKSSTDLKIDQCPVCGEEEREAVLEMYGINWVQCHGCSHVYQPEILSQEALIEFYESDEDYASTYTDEEQMEYRLENVTKPKFDFVLDKIDVERGRWLDVGCGNGGSVHYLESLGWEADGLEVSEHSVQTAADYFGVEIHQRTLEEYHEKNPDAEFDGISMFGYLDLVQDPVSDLELASEMLGEGGYIAVHVPKYDSVSLRVQQTFPDQAVRVLSWNLLHFYTEKSLEEAFSQTGFEIRTTWYYGLDFYEMMMNLCLSVDDFMESDLYDYFMKNLNEFQQTVDNTEMSDYSTIIAEKTGT